MDLTRLRPTITCLSGKARKQGCILRSGTRLSTWIAACKLALPDQDLERSAARRRLLTCLFAPLNCSLHRLFALLSAELAENPDRPTRRPVAEDNWFGLRSATPSRSTRDLSSIMRFADFALWPSFCSSSWQPKWASWVWRATGIACLRGTDG